MKGYLNKIEEWFVIYDQRTMQDPTAEDGMLPLHPHDVAISSFGFYNGKVVEFEIMQYDGTIPILNAWNGYVKLVDSYPVSEETKPHSFCETPEEKCTMSYCDENGCINRKRNLVAEPSSPTDENGKPLTYWGGLKDRTCTNSCSVVCGECQLPTSSQTEISDDRTKLHWKTSLVIHTPEISDEEIKEFASESKSIFKEDMYRAYFIMGAKWYREQLKTK